MLGGRILLVHLETKIVLFCLVEMDGGPNFLVVALNLMYHPSRKTKRILLSYSMLSNRYIRAAVPNFQNICSIRRSSRSKYMYVYM